MSESPSLLARALVPLGVIILLAVGAAIFLFYLQSQNPTLTKPMAHLPAPNASTQPAQITTATVEPSDVAVNPAQTVTAGSALAPVHRADVFTDANELWNGLRNSVATSVGALLVPEEFVRKFAIAIYGLSEGRLVSQNRPYISPEGTFTVAKLNEGPQAQFRLLEQNADRYRLYLEALRWANSDAGIAMYERAYPQLQSAFEELGLGKRSFHQIAIIAIDNLLAAPDPAGELILEQPKTRFVYSNAELEKLPATHKLMLRIGATNNQAVKQQLRQLRQRLVAIKF
ncbi:MAG TPA: DUF3014 domain-containing protein [Cellvibrionaceae bacterium]